MSNETFLVIFTVKVLKPVRKGRAPMYIPIREDFSLREGVDPNLLQLGYTPPNSDILSLFHVPAEEIYRARLALISFPFRKLQIVKSIVSKLERVPPSTIATHTLDELWDIYKEDIKTLYDRQTREIEDDP